MPTKESGFPVVSSTLFTTPANLSITVPSGLTNPALIVFTFHERAGDVVSGVTFNADAMTQVAVEDPTTWSKVTCWKLANPDVATANVAVSRSSGGTNAMRIIAYLVSSADQTNIVRTPAQSSADTGTSASNTVGSVASSDLLLDQISIDSTGHSPTAGANQTAEYATQNLGAGTNEGRGSSQSGADGGVMSWTWTTSAPFSHVAVAIIHDAGAGGAQTVTPTGISTGEAFGTPVVTQEVVPTGIASAEAFGTPVAVLFNTPTGIASQEAFGTPLVNQSVSPTGIPSAEAFGAAPSLPQIVTPASIPSAEAFGVPTIDGGVQVGSSPTRMPMTGVGN